MVPFAFAILKRKPTSVRLIRKIKSTLAGNEVAQTFSSKDEVEHYLNYWTTDSTDIFMLRSALNCYEASSSVSSLLDTQVIRLLAGHVAQGALVLTQSNIADAQIRMPNAKANAATALRAALHHIGQLVSTPTMSDEEVLQFLADKLNSSAPALAVRG